MLTGKGAAFLQLSGLNVAIQPGDDVEKKLKEALKKITATVFKIDGRSGVAVVLPANIFDITDALKVFGKLMSMEGTLTTTDNPVLIGLSGSQGARAIPLLIVDKATLLNDRNKAEFPAENHAVVEAVARKGEIKIGTETTEWSLENADGRIPFMVPKGGTSPEAGIRLRVAGKVRVVDGKWLLEATKMEPIKRE